MAFKRRKIRKENTSVRVLFLSFFPFLFWALNKSNAIYTYRSSETEQNNIFRAKWKIRFRYSFFMAYSAITTHIFLNGHFRFVKMSIFSSITCPYINTHLMWNLSFLHRPGLYSKWLVMLTLTKKNKIYPKDVRIFFLHMRDYITFYYILSLHLQTDQTKTNRRIMYQSRKYFIYSFSDFTL
jgi:hypothetical protein